VDGAARHVDGAIALFIALDTPVHLERARSLLTALETGPGRSAE
jgi:hypothetical protein